MRWLFIVITVALSLLSFNAHAATTNWQASSPNEKITATVRQTSAGALEYSVSLGGSTVIEWSPMGITLGWVDQGQAEAIRFADFSKGVKVKDHSVRKIADRYTMVTGKRRDNIYNANELRLELSASKNGKNADLLFQVADDGVAFRYVFTDQSLLYHWTERENIGFNLGLGGTHWGQIFDKPNAWQPAYEAPYKNGVPIGTDVEENEGPGWGIPALFRDENGVWILLHEAGLTKQYHGAHLAAQATGGQYRLTPPLAEDGMGIGDIRPMMTLPGATPWRFMMISNDLRTIVESNRVFDLSPAQLQPDTSWIKPGTSSWSWLTDHDSSRDLGKLKSHIKLAAEMGWEYSLVDANWNKIAPDAVEQLVAEGNRAGVGLLFWYNSGGRHNAVTEEPRNIMDDSDRRRAEFAKLQRLGVKGVKIDFFHSDKQDRIAQYIEILEDAAEYKLLVNFHGCTIPRGWQRTYPHLMTMEAVRGGEHYSFDSEPNFAQLSTYQNSILPFTRNVIGSMDFTPIGFSLQRRPHLTTNAHEAALGVIFESGIQHMADSVAGYRAASADYKRYLADLPTVWDETRFLSGYPGRDILIARRAGNRWYIAGINSENKSKSISVDLKFLRKSHKALILRDGSNPHQFNSEHSNIPNKNYKMKMEPFGGFVMVLGDTVGDQN